jgi:hypothetical protein
MYESLFRCLPHALTQTKDPCGTSQVYVWRRLHYQHGTALQITQSTPAFKPSGKCLDAVIG